MENQRKPALDVLSCGGVACGGKFSGKCHLGASAENQMHYGGITAEDATQFVIALVNAKNECVDPKRLDTVIQELREKFSLKSNLT